MNKPQPKQIAVVPMNPGQLQIWTANPVAERWVRHEAKDFGELRRQLTPDGDPYPYLILTVSPLYNLQEVIEFLEQGPYSETGVITIEETA